MNKKLIEGVRELLKEKYKKTEKITVAWPLFDEKEVIAILDTLAAVRVSSGKLVSHFEEKFASYIGVKYAIACNSGSSANLLALNTLLEAGDLKRGDGVVIPASTFITVATPVVQLGLKPIFVDVETDSYNIDPNQIERCAKEASAIMVVHSLGNPAKIDQIIKIARQNKLKVIEDCCEAHGAEYAGKRVGSFGDLSTFSFFVAHNMTTGEGGMILTNNEKYYRILKSLREFGRVDQTSRFSNFPHLGRYDTRYVFERLGYNLRMTDLQAAIGVEQLKKLDKFNKIRRNIASFYSKKLAKYSKFFQFPTENGYHSYYSYLFVLKKGVPFLRDEIVDYLEGKGIETRPFFAGSIPDQPGFKNVDLKKVGSLPNSEWLKNNAFFIGCHPGIGQKERDYIISAFEAFIAQYKKK